MRPNFFCLHRCAGRNAAAFVMQVVRIEDFAVFAGRIHTEAVTFAHHWREVADDDNAVAFAVASLEDEYGIITIIGNQPFEAFRPLVYW